MTLTEILDELGIEIAPSGHHHSRDEWIQIDCPFCSHRSSRYLLGISENSKAVNCYFCGPHRLWETLAHASSQPLKAIVELCKGFTRERPAERILERNNRLEMPAGVGKLLKPHRRYLAMKRKLDPDEIVSLWGIQGIGPISNIPWRLFIPIRMGVETVSWTTRSISDDVDLRYITATPKQERMSSRDILYGAENARHCIIIHEGPIDAWTVGPGAVATCGTGFSKAQVLLMSSFPVRVVCFDAEPPAQRRARDLCQMLEVFDGETYQVTLQTGKDPNSASKNEIKELRRRFL